MRKSHAFTLVELLVVIGIIAVLISILLPSLAKARQHANNVACMANLRQIGQGLLFYANEHRGKLPYSGNATWGDIWPGQVTQTLGVDLRYTGDQFGNVVGNYSAVLRCPDAPIEGIGLAWNGGFHYTANCRAMPWAGTSNDGLKNGQLMLPYPLATKDSASKVLIWDGPLLPDFGWNAPTSNMPQCFWFLTWGYADPCTWTNWWADPNNGFTGMDDPVPPAQDMAYVNLNSGSPQWIGTVNRDGLSDGNEFPWSIMTVGLQRYRHLDNTSANFLYFDGHVESKKLGQLLFRDLSIYPY